MKPLTLEETRLKEQMKERCLAKGQYIDENAKAKFDMLCHLEDFEVQYWELQQENKQLKEHIEKYEHYCKTTGIEELMKENKKYKEVIDKAIKCIDYNTKHRNGADIYQFVDIESEILKPLKFILELDEENGNAYLKEFKDWLNEVE